MDHRGGNPQHDSPDPDRIVGPRGVVDAAPEPDPEEPADLVAEEDDPVERREPGRSEDLGHHAAGEGHGRQPQEADGAGEDQGGGGGDGHDQEAADDEGPGEVEEAEEVLLAVAVAEAAEEPGSPHVEQPHKGEGRGRDHLGEPVIAEVGRQVGGDEGDVEAADEEAGVQQQVARVPARPRQQTGEVIPPGRRRGCPLGGLRCRRKSEGEGGDGRDDGGAVQAG